MFRNYLNLILKKNFFIFFLVFAIPIFSITGPALPDISATILALTLLIKIFILNEKNEFYENLTFYKISITVFLLILFTTFFSEYINYSFSKFSVNLRYFIYALFLQYFFIKNRSTIDKFIVFICIICLLISIDIFIQFYFDYDIFLKKADSFDNKTRLCGPFCDEYIAGTYLAKYSLIPIGYYFFKYKDNNVKTFYLLILLMLIYSAVVLTGERMALILFTSGISLIFLFNFSFKKCLIFVSFILLIYLFLYKNFEQVRYKANEFLTLTGFIDKDYSFWDSGHGAHYQTAYAIFKSSPVFGSGYKTFRIVCDKENIKKQVISKSKGCTTHPHNVYLEALSDTGLIGFTSLLGYFLFLLVKSYKNKIYRSQYNGILASFIIIIFPISSFSNFFNNWNAIINFTVIGLLMFALKANQDYLRTIDSK